MQYAAALILLHRPVAHFGTDSDSTAHTSASETSRQICVYNACLIAQYLQEYYEKHGSVLTMSWVALHIIATASTTLVANIAERKGSIGFKSQLSCLQTCMRSLNELEKSHVVTRRVRKVIQHAIRLLDLDSTIDSMSASLPYEGSSSQLAGLSAPLVTPSQDLAFASARLEAIPEVFQFNDLLPVWSQFDMLNSFESYFSG
ncbi:uncharacterized protein BDZ99DRAFT_213426 [Mytilinidion resinicola]|uniref:Transcription factor domain-containing protein n=1 Tax=Mytilinidion resinicola TaxID=574789 RepID=A0A6A6XZ10_9PEZI|nr:uncharacterized protein BDZ99DRAFT_213426 [Mytilinidion resinicola]KAF2801806.1 hypothetical protein BDZ99DRAFT_213426 [Mytilinidion resinicola]